MNYIYHSVRNAVSSLWRSLYARFAFCVNDYPMLHHAIKSNNIACMELLIEHGADVNAKRLLGFPLLHHTIQSNNIACMKLLIEHGADVNAERLLDIPILNHAIRNNKIECVKLLIENGADVNATSLVRPFLFGFSLLYDAIRSNKIECVKLLIENGAVVNARCNNGDPMLLHAFRNDNNIECVSLLIENGADVNTRCRLGLPMLHHAIQSNSFNCLQILIENGADVKVITPEDRLVFEQMARIVLKLSVIRLLYRHVSPIRPAIKVILHKRREEAEICVELMLTPKTLLRHRPEMDTRNNRLRAALSKACKEGQEDVAVCLIQMGADPWCAGLCVDTGKDIESPWESCAYFEDMKREMENAYNRRLFVVVSVVDKFGDNLSKRLKERDLDVWRICLSFLF
eukprot:gene1285-2482_t